MQRKNRDAVPRAVLHTPNNNRRKKQGVRVTCSILGNLVIAKRCYCNELDDVNRILGVDHMTNVVYTNKQIIPCAQNDVFLHFGDFLFNQDGNLAAEVRI